MRPKLTERSDVSLSRMEFLLKKFIGIPEKTLKKFLHAGPAELILDIFDVKDQFALAEEELQRRTIYAYFVVWNLKKHRRSLPTTENCTRDIAEGNFLVRINCVLNEGG